jgi:hypothetical protein
MIAPTEGTQSQPGSLADNEGIGVVRVETRLFGQVLGTNTARSKEAKYTVSQLRVHAAVPGLCSRTVLND